MSIIKTSDNSVVIITNVVKLIKDKYPPPPKKKKNHLFMHFSIAPLPGVMSRSLTSSDRIDVTPVLTSFRYELATLIEPLILPASVTKAENPDRDMFQIRLTYKTNKQTNRLYSATPRN